MTAANLTLLPWVRRGAAANHPEPDDLGANSPAMSATTTLQAHLKVNNQPPVTMKVRLRGPADVLGIDPNEIVRLDPRPGTTDFEPNYFPCIEFDQPDFPWLFTPAHADGQGRVRPWLCLAVVRPQDGVTLHPPTGSGQNDAARLPVLEVAAPLIDRELPDLAESWAWAHAQVAADNNSDDVTKALDGAPEGSLSRLLCPRLLSPNTDYLACVVPTFALGARAGLNETIPDDQTTGSGALTPAWSTPVQGSPPPPVRLPVYFSWQFRTGIGGDFQYLAELLTARPAPDRLGLRTVDISRPGFALPAGAPPSLFDGATLDVEGALEPATPVPPRPTTWPPNLAPPFQAALTGILNAPDLAVVADPTKDPLLAPPLYGRWHAARATVNPDNPAWFDALNTDPRHRIVAAFGTRVVQQHQEALMASAWEQAGDRGAYERARRLQLSAEVNTSLHTRHLARLDDETRLRVAAPALARLPSADSSPSAPSTVLGAVDASMLPVRAVSAAMRRIGRQRGPITRRVISQGGQRNTAQTWIRRLNTAPPAPRPSRLVTFEAVRSRLTAPIPNPFLWIRPYGEVTAQIVKDALGRDGFQVAAEGQPVPFPQLFLPDDPAAKAFRDAAAKHLAAINPGRKPRSGGGPRRLDVTLESSALLANTRAHRTVAALARATISVGANATEPAPQQTTPGAGIESIMAPAPQFRQPMYEALRDLGQELLLPGLDGIDPNTVLGLQTNRRFVEAYLVGLNMEMGRELLWRGFPTDQRGTCFAQFWDTRSADPDDQHLDIEPIHQWGDRRLGDPPATAVGEQFVVLLRSDLLRRYPATVIYAVPAQETVQAGVRVRAPSTAGEVYPVFRGSMEPDVSFFGFNLSSDDMLTGGSGSGYYIVIQEQPTEPRFGLDVKVRETMTVDASHLVVDPRPSEVPLPTPPTDLQWGFNAAHMAAITRQRPVRIAMHASRFQDALS